ncbi:MAG: ABC transporter ATP-binding protein [Proteobacteria bacterium]|nr:ABC transporter ATP-binding protein [Pseudomonadota bacterium]MBI3498045.1 ABC transporter ATP-binding protein [Pseudomonadota bacterium]
MSLRAEPLLSVRGLSTSFGGPPVVEGVSFDLAAGEVLGIVGESGSGKSVTALSIMRLISHPGRVVAGRIFFEGEDLLAKSEAEMRKIRGERISMIFQEPMTSLNPVFTVGDQIVETLRYHQGMGRKDAAKKAIELLKLVEIPTAERRVDEYPHQMSGGMRQRVMIAMALACRPKLLIADEPTTALDVTIQAQILDLLRQLQRELNMAVILITHDLGVVAEFVQRVIVMYAARTVEQASVSALFSAPQHPYTEGLLESIPQLDQVADRLQAIEGTIPSLQDMPTGCRFHPRCRYAQAPCAELDPPLFEVAEGRFAACIRHTGYRLPSLAEAAS